MMSHSAPILNDVFEGSVAIVGMAGRFPGAPDIDALWNALREGKDCITRFTRRELLSVGIPSELIDRPDYVRARGVLDGADLFDADFFSMSPREAELTDPQQRLFLECAWTALEHAGVAAGPFGVRSVGVYAGTGWPSYLLQNVGSHAGLLDSDAGHQILLGNDKDNLTLRVSYKLGLEGPSITVQTGCSSSLVAIALAYDALILHQCDFALAGGVSVIFPQYGYQFKEGGIFSPDGYCRPFDAGAHGTVLGSGVGIVVLKRLEDAIADGHHIYAVIRSAAVNNDGRAKSGYTAPSAEAQARVIANALAFAGITADDVSYVETHGTGTRLGDQIEMEGLIRAFRARATSSGPCLIGSIKSNIGHLDAAAGVAGVIKTALALERREIPPTLNFTEASPDIDWSDSCFRVCRDRVGWESCLSPSRAGVSSFGLGGTNAHLILEQAPEHRSSTIRERGVYVVPLSAKTSISLDQQAANLTRHLTDHPTISIEDIARTLTTGRCAFKHRCAVVCSSTEQLRMALARANEKEMFRGVASDTPPSIAFVFSGWSTALRGVGRQLYASEWTFRQNADVCLDRLRSLCGIDLGLLLDSTNGFVTSDAGLEQMVLFVVEYAMARLWISWGVTPTAVMGEGVGEIAAAVTAGIFSLDEGLALITHRLALPGPTTHTFIIESLQRLRPNRPAVPFLSTATGTWLSESDCTDTAYWTRENSKQGHFEQAIEFLLREQACTILHIPLVEQSTIMSTTSRKAMIVSSLLAVDKLGTESEFLFNSLAELWVQGVPIVWDSVPRISSGRRIPLPTYPFVRKSHWLPAAVLTTEGKQNDNGLWTTMANAAATSINSAVIDPHVYWSRHRQLEELSAFYANRALVTLGILDSRSQLATAEDLKTHGIIVGYWQLARDLAAWHLECGENCHRSLDSAGDNTETSLIKSCGAALPDILTGRRDPRELFHGLLNEKWTDGPSHQLKQQYCKALRSALSSAIENHSHDRVLKILEIGGGTGIATRTILPALPPTRSEYTFTDISTFFLARAQSEFANFPFVRYRKLDINESPMSQGFVAEKYDVVIAVNVLHIARSIDGTLGHVRSLLTPGGVGLIWEITEQSLPFAVTYGLIMPTLNDGLRSQGRPFLSEQAWTESLRRNGFSRVSVLPNSKEFKERLFIAQANSVPSLIHRNGVANFGMDRFAKKLDPGDWVFVPSWHRTPPLIGNTAERINPNRLVLIFTDATGLGRELAVALTNSGSVPITVGYGESLDCRDRNRVMIRRSSREDYVTLIDTLVARGQWPAKIVYLWGVEKHGKEIDSASDAVDIIAPVLFLAQALGSRPRGHGIEILVITTGAHDVVGNDTVDPRSALLLGPCRVIPIEYPGISCRAIDITLPRTCTQWHPSLIRALRLEIENGARESMVAYRSTHRWAHTIEPIHAPRPLDFGGLLREGGVYLITGGLGTIGLAIAEFIARFQKATLLLTGRSPVPEAWDRLTSTDAPRRSIFDRLRQLRTLGATVVPIQADVANFSQMKAVVEDARARYGPVNGVVHSAGILGDGSIQRKTLEELYTVLKPKVAGALVLDRLFERTPLDFFMLFSALSAIKPAFGQVAYSAANNFLETFASYRTSRGDATMCISWDVWRDEGMAFDAQTPYAFRRLKEQDIAVRGISFEEGIDVFGRCLCMGLPLTFVSTTGYISDVGYDVTSMYMKRFDEMTHTAKAPPTIQPVGANASLTETEGAIADIWRRLLGVGEIRPDDNFFELGGDSLVGMQVIARISECFGITVTQDNLFEHRTVATLARLVEEKLLDRVRPDQLYRIIQQTENRNP